jgi:hypothetical protein
MNRIIYKNPCNIYLNNISTNYFYDDIYISPYYYKEPKYSLNQSLNNISIDSYINYANNILDNEMLNNLNDCLHLDIKKIIDIYSIHFISKKLRDDIFKLCDNIIIKENNNIKYNTFINLNDKYFSKIYKHKYKYITNSYGNMISLYRDNICNNLIDEVIFNYRPNILTDDNKFYINKPLKKIELYDISYI